MGANTTAYYSCSATLNNEMLIFGGTEPGDYTKQISKIIGCRLERIGELPYDFYFGACGTFQFHDSNEQRVMLCFPARARDKCYR